MSLVLERSVDALVGDVLAIVKTLGVDAEQDFDAVPGPLGHPRRRHPGRPARVILPRGAGRRADWPGARRPGPGSGPGSGLRPRRH
jgi:hypothetical protein